MFFATRKTGVRNQDEMSLLEPFPLGESQFRIVASPPSGIGYKSTGSRYHMKEGEGVPIMVKINRRIPWESGRPYQLWATNKQLHGTARFTDHLGSRGIFRVPVNSYLKRLVPVENVLVDVRTIVRVRIERIPLAKRRLQNAVKFVDITRNNRHGHYYRCSSEPIEHGAQSEEGEYDGRQSRLVQRYITLHTIVSGASFLRYNCPT